MTVEQAIQLLPDAPDFDAALVYRREASGDDGKRDAKPWIPLAELRRLLNVTDTGLAKIRERLRRSFEHRDKSGCVYVYGPLWFRVWSVSQAQ